MIVRNFNDFPTLVERKNRNVIMSKSNKVENKNGTNVEMLDAYKCQHMIVRNFNALTLTRTFSPSLLFLFSTFSFFGIFTTYFRPKLGLPLQRPHPSNILPLLLFLFSIFRHFYVSTTKVGITEYTTPTAIASFALRCTTATASFKSKCKTAPNIFPLSS